MFREGLLMVVCGPSGVGKGTVLKSVRENNDNIRFSISATTRMPRQGEVDGLNYFFITPGAFQEMVQKDELVEWVEYCGNCYGTPQKYIEECLKDGFDVLLEIEVEGAANIRKKYPDVVSVFILPPSFSELKHRIEGRGTEKEEVIQKRMERAKQEMMLVDQYDYVIINDSVEKAVEKLNCILRTEKLKVRRNPDILKQIGVL